MTDEQSEQHRHEAGELHGHNHSPGNDGLTDDVHEGLDQATLSPFAYRVMAMRELIIEHGLVGREELDAFGDSLERLSPANGARLVARAWVDANFRSRLLADTQRAAAEIGIVLPSDPRIVVLENRADVHHLVVCTLCSCYPRALLGRPPDWYKSLEYRSRAVSEPRAVLEEFGLRLTEDVAVRVVDSTADCRYLVLPMRPSGTEGLTEEELVGLVTRNSMIGTGGIARQG